MKILALAPVVLLAACGSSNIGDGNGAAEPANAVTSAVPGSEPATSANAKAARAVVEQYYALIAQKKYGAARRLWDDDGAASGGDEAAFAKTITPYAEYRAKVGAPTDIAAADGKQYIKVATDLYVKRRSNGAVAERTGVVMLRRSADPKDDGTPKGAWRIWGADIRTQSRSAAESQRRSN